LRRLEVGESGAQTVELRIEDECVLARRRILAQPFRGEREGRRRATQLVLGPREAVCVHHTASVSL
jgi:hypothetical protein